MNLYNREHCEAVQDAWKWAMYSFMANAHNRPTGVFCWINHPLMSPGRVRYVVDAAAAQGFGRIKRPY